MTVPAGSAKYVLDTDSVNAAMALVPTVNMFNYLIGLGGGATLTAGSQVVDVGASAVLGTEPTSLVGGTTYTASILVDGVHTMPISILGSTAATFAALVAQINIDLNGKAVAALVGGDIKITSTKVGAGSAIAITAGTLFAAPLAGFVAVNAAVAGVTPVTGMTMITNESKDSLVGLVAGKDLMADDLVLMIADTALFGVALMAIAGTYVAV